jgi:hypothetical protein
LDQTGLLNDVIISANNIDNGRKGFAVPGKERQGRISYEDGIARALQSFRDALRSLATVEDAAAYKSAETTYSTDPKKRVQGFPLDVFHQACGSHSTRLRNILRVPGIEMLEKALLKQRAVNMTAAQGAYAEKQRKALTDKR